MDYLYDKIYPDSLLDSDILLCKIVNLIPEFFGKSNVIFTKDNQIDTLIDEFYLIFTSDRLRVKITMPKELYLDVGCDEIRISENEIFDDVPLYVLINEIKNIKIERKIPLWQRKIPNHQKRVKY